MTIGDVLSKIDRYQQIVRRAYGTLDPFSSPCHRLATSKLGLSSLAVYEYARYKGAPLPNSNTIVEWFAPSRDSRRKLFGRNSPPDSFQSVEF